MNALVEMVFRLVICGLVLVAVLSLCDAALGIIRLLQ